MFIVVNLAGMEFAEMFRGSPLMEYSILGSLYDRVEKRLKDANSTVWIDRVQLLVRELFRILPAESEVYLLGSVLIGLATGNSDVDFYVDFDGSNYKAVVSCSKRNRNLRELLFYYLTKNGINNVFTLRDIVCEARVPVLRITHVPSGVDIDLSVANGLGVENSKLLKLYLDSDPRVKWLVVVIHEWTSQVGLMGKTPLFRPYALTWLILFFLMKTSPQVVCPVVDLLDGKQKKVVGGWNCNFEKFLPITENQEPRINLLAGFLNFVVSTDFATSVICPLTGDLMARESFARPSELPSCFLPYQWKMKAQEGKGLNVITAICLEDPVDLSHNITQLVHEEVLKKFIQLCRDSLAARYLLVNPVMFIILKSG